MAEYQVQNGDTLSKIASQNNTTVQNLATLNNIQDINKIGVGQKINLSSNVPTVIPVTALTAPTAPVGVVTQPQVSTGAVTLNSDIISKGQADTARAVAEEARVATMQGTKAPSSTESVLKEILGQTPNPTATTTAPPTAQSQLNERNAIQNFMNETQGKTTLTAGEYAGTVDPARKELNSINAQINDESLAGRRRIEAILQTPGVTKQGAADMVNEIQRTNASKLADLSVVQMARQGQYDSAKEIADRAVQVKVEDQKNKLSALMFTYTENKELFTKTEQRDFETAQADRTRKLNNEEENLQRVSDLSLQALQSGAPTSVVTKMRNAKTESEAITIGGQYVGLLDRQVKIANINQSNASIRASDASVNKTYLEIKQMALQNQQGAAVTPGKKPIGKPDSTLATFANRVSEANGILNSVEIGKKGNGLTNFIFTSRKAESVFKATEYKQYDQARDNFITAVLRKESGAAIGKDEYETADRQYFAQVGDTQEVILQKQRNRIDTLNGLIAGAGRAYNGTFQEKPSQYKNASYEQVNPFTTTLKTTTSSPAIYNSATGYSIPK